MPITSVRDHRLDIAKGVLICLVVLGHLLEGMNNWKVPESRVPLTIIYAFHMPAFAFLAGITAKPTNLVRRVGPLLVLLALFQVAYYWTVQLLGLKRTFALDTPFWILWFLFALACWTMLTPVMARFPKASTTVVIAAALMAITVPWIGYPYSAARMLAFLPFFTVGFLYGKRILAWTAAATWPLKCALSAGSVVAIVVLLRAQLTPRWFYGSASAEALNAGQLEAVVVRSGLMVGAAVLTVTLLAFLPNRKTIWATVGRRSLSVYLLHGFFVLTFSASLARMFDAGHLRTLLLVAVLAVGTVTICAAPGLDSILRKISTAPFAQPKSAGIGAQQGATTLAPASEPVSRRSLRR